VDVLDDLQAEGSFTHFALASIEALATFVEPVGQMNIVGIGTGSRRAASPSTPCRSERLVIEHMGAEKVIYGSDRPHMEGMEDPRDIFEDPPDPGSRASFPRHALGRGSRLREA